MKRLNLLAAFLAGIVFAVGLALSGMTQPSKVLGFLDFTGNWDPSLMFVMGGAIGVHIWFARRALRSTKTGGRPLLDDSYQLPTATQIDARLLGGAALFGIGWGLAGYCPGPALVSLVHPTVSAFAFVAAMTVGIAAARPLANRSNQEASL